MGICGAVCDRVLGQPVKTPLMTNEEAVLCLCYQPLYFFKVQFMCFSFIHLLWGLGCMVELEKSYIISTVREMILFGICGFIFLHGSLCEGENQLK